MAKLIMQKGLIYTVKVLKIEHCKKQIFGDPKPQYKHCITIEDGNGKSATCEYLSPDKEVSPDIFEVGAFYRQIRCVNTHEFGDTIEPFDQEEKPQTHPFDTPKPGAQPIAHYEPGEEKSYTQTVNLSGKSITFATAYAKDLLVAEMRTWEPGREVKTLDIDHMMDMAEQIARRMAKGINL